MKLRIGTRGSRLALAQAREVADAIIASGVETELVTITTAGDRGADPASDPAGVKGLFVTEIVRALLDGDVDLAVHSAKDLPADDTEGVVIGAVPERASALDVLVTRDGDLRPGARVGTSSIRRRAQVFRLRPDVIVEDLRGNVDTRLRKLGDGEVDALIIAGAGLLRLGVVPEHAAPMSLSEMVPAPGQGCLAVQARTSDGATIEALSVLDHAASRMALEAERGLMARLGGGCSLPLGAFAESVPRGVRLLAIALSPDGSRIVRTQVDGETPEEVAELAALDLSAGGADEILGLVRP
ncbi:MAG TPA: hydroxymethylbilane synthase [Actinomycetota bacterium]|nr:hydroxymethylbilane synthase [Actinomycetota bacterium]